MLCTLCAIRCSGPLFSKDLDRTAGSKRAYEGAPLCATLCAGHGFPKISIVETDSKGTHHDNNFRHVPSTCGGDMGREGRDKGGVQGGKGGRDTSNSHRAVMRDPMRDPMRDVDLMVLGYVGGRFHPFASRTREQRSIRKPHPGSSFQTVAAHGSNFKL